jgi:hypothetical protein
MSQAKVRWSTTYFRSTGDARQDLALLCATLTKDISHPAWCCPIILLVPWKHMMYGWFDACYEGLGVLRPVQRRMTHHIV